MKKFIISILIISIIAPLTPYSVEAKGNDDFNNSCSINNINEETIVGIEIIDGEIYIDVLSSRDNNIVLFSSIGKCPNSTKTTYAYATKSELVSMKKKLDNQTLSISSLVGFLTGLINPVVGGATGYLLSQPNMMSSAIEDALYNRNKNDYTIRTKMKCEETNLGSRGIVHRYKITSIYIY